MRMAEAGHVAHGWEVSAGMVLVELVYTKGGPNGSARAVHTLVNLADEASIGRLLDGLDSPKAAGMTESALREVWGDAAARWHRSLNSWQRRPRGALSASTPVADAGPP
jgi:hypothetical protein